jgi:hypothetical protein
MIFLSLILDLLLSLGIGMVNVDAAVTDHHFGHEGARRGHSVHGHTTTEHHGMHGHTAPPSAHEPNPHGGQAL